MSDPTKILDGLMPEVEHADELRPISAESFDNIIHNRRSVRNYTDEKIPEEVVKKVLDWALLAPNSSNLQCWEFYWVRSPEKKVQLVEACFGQPAARTAQELIVAVAKLDGWKTVRKQMLEIFDADERVPPAAKHYYKTLVPLVYGQGPLNILGFAKTIFTTIAGLFKPLPREPQSRADMRVWAVKSVALACENIMLGFSSFGYDSCPMEGLDSARVKRILGLGRNQEVVMAISAGKRDKKGVYGPRIRMPRDQFVKTV